MKIIILSDANSIHTRRWASALSHKSIELIVFSLFALKEELLSFYYNNKIRVISADLEKYGITKYSPVLIKPIYFLALKKLKKEIKSFSPDLIHAHYASSYGILAALCKFKPYYISIWGDDIVIRKKNFLLKKLLKYSFKNSENLFSTSNIIDDHIKNEFNCRTTIIPFGVDTNLFKPIKAMKGKPIKIGIIKSLEPYNGIEYLIDAFNILMKKKILDVELKILGEGSNAKKLKKYVNNLGLNDHVIFEGQIKHTDIVPYYNELSIFACPSLRESFGVSVLEASACGLPVIANNIGGLKDIVVHGKTGYLIDTLNIKEFAFYLEKLILDNDLRKKMGKNGRNFTKEKYEWSNCVDSLISNY